MDFEDWCEQNGGAHGTTGLDEHCALPHGINVQKEPGGGGPAVVRVVNGLPRDAKNHWAAVETSVEFGDGEITGDFRNDLGSTKRRFEF